MSKELTEQWKNRTLKDNWYYILFANEKLIGIDGCTDSVFWHTDNKILKILAPVPSYDQFSQMVKKVDELEKEKAELLEKIEELKDESLYWEKSSLGVL